MATWSDFILQAVISLLWPVWQDPPWGESSSSGILGIDLGIAGYHSVVSLNSAQDDGFLHCIPRETALGCTERPLDRRAVHLHEVVQVLEGCVLNMLLSYTIVSNTTAALLRKCFQMLLRGSHVAHLACQCPLCKPLRQPFARDFQFSVQTVPPSSLNCSGLRGRLLNCHHAVSVGW